MNYYFPTIENYFETAIEELGILAQVALLDPRLQIEVAPVPTEGFPVLAFVPVQQHEWITKQIEVRPATEVLLVLFEPEVERLPVEVVINTLSTNQDMRSCICEILRPEMSALPQKRNGNALPEWKISSASLLGSR